MDAAVEAFSERDYDEVSVDAVAVAAGASHGLAFQYFGSKKGLYVAALDAVIERFEERVLNLASGGGERDLSELRASLAVYVDWAAAHPAGFRSLMRNAAGMSETRERVERLRRRGLEPIVTAAGLDPDDPRTRIALRAWIGFNEAAILAWLDEGGADREALVSLVTRSLVDVVAGLRRVDPSP